MTTDGGRTLEITCGECGQRLELGLRELVARPGRRCPSCSSPLADEELRREMERIRRFLEELVRGAG